MHILLPTVQRRHKHPNTDQDVSCESHRLCYHARSPSRPNLEALHLPSSVLSPQLHDRSASSVVPVPGSARHTRPSTCPLSSNTTSSTPSRSSAHLVIYLLLTCFEINSTHYSKPSLSFQRKPSAVVIRTALKPLDHTHTNETRRLPLPWMVIAS